MSETAQPTGEVFGVQWADLTQEYLMALTVADVDRIMVSGGTLQYGADESLLDTVAWLQTSAGPEYELEIATWTDLIMNPSGEVQTHNYIPSGTPPGVREKLDLKNGVAGVIHTGAIGAIIHPNRYYQVDMSPTEFRGLCQAYIRLTSYQPPPESPSPIHGMNAEKLENNDQ